MANYFIIGGSSGIGKELVDTLSRDGHMVYATYNTHAVSSDDPNVEYHPLNVLDPEYAVSFLPEQIDGLAYCPGSIHLRPFHRIKPGQFLSDYELQVVGAVRVIQEILPLLKKSGSSSVVLFSTVAVQSGFNFHSQVAASKGAVEGLMRSLAAELAPGIRVNCVAPSLTDTPLASRLINTEEKRSANAQRHPLKKIGSPKDIAGAAAYLLSEKAGWITGQVLPVDGGISSLKN